MVSRPAPCPAPPTTLQVTAPTPSDTSGGSGHFLTVINQASCSSSLRDSGPSLHPPCSTSPSPRQSQLTPQPEELIMEIKRLRDRLRILESENMRLSATINSTNRQVDIRLNEIEQRLEEDSSQEDFSIEEEEKNQESFI